MESSVSVSVDSSESLEFVETQPAQQTSSSMVVPVHVSLDTQESTVFVQELSTVQPMNTMMDLPVSAFQVTPETLVEFVSDLMPAESINFSMAHHVSVFQGTPESMEFVPESSIVDQMNTLTELLACVLMDIQGSTVYAPK